MAVKLTKDVMNTNHWFSTPVYDIEKTEWVDKTIKATDKYIKESEKRLQPELKER